MIPLIPFSYPLLFLSVIAYLKYMAAAFKLAISRLTLFAIFLFSVVFSANCVTGAVFAGSGLVSTIGGATFIQGSNQFWVTSIKPTFSGVTTASAAVTGTVGSQSVTATADASGNWSWTPATELSGDNPVSITSGSSTTAFTLTIGDVPADIASASASTLEPAGTITPTFLILGLGIILVGIGALGFKLTSKSFD